LIAIKSPGFVEPEHIADATNERLPAQSQPSFNRPKVFYARDGEQLWGQQTLVARPSGF
jgi:hypothetical protein